MKVHVKGIRDTPFQDQGAANTCAANVCREMSLFAGVDVSVMWSYFIGRVAGGNTELLDDGVALSTLLEAVEEFGVVSEEEWPFDPYQLSSPPPRPLHISPCPITYARVSHRDVLRLLKNNFPVAAVVETSDAFVDFVSSPELTSNVFAGAGKDDTSPLGHAVLLVGWDSTIGGPGGSFVALSSWGKSWGECGSAYLPATFIHDTARSEQFYVATSRDTLLL
jgi:C1A family cysteine protease